MGIRLYLGTGYGILLKKNQIKKLDPDKIENTLERFYIDKLEECFDYIRKRDSGEDHDNESMEAALNVVEFGDMLKEYVQGKNIRSLVDGQLAIPNEEWGTKSFFGYMQEKHWNDDVDYAMLEHLGMKVGESFEIHLPIKLDGIKEGEAKDGVKVYLPITGMGILERALKKRMDAGMKDDEILFTSKEECERETILAAKETMYMDSVHYKKGLEMVKIFYPSTTLENVEKYIVGWWS